jgi:signal transduction histidine kinase
LKELTHSAATEDGELDERARLRAENAALNEQVKLLVQIEQRLYRSQNAREQEFRRIRALGAFALAVASIVEHDQVLARAVGLLNECFSLDRIAVLSWTEQREVRRCVEPGRPKQPVPVSGEEFEALSALAGVVLAEREALPPVLRGIFEKLGPPPGNAVCLAIPAGLTRAAIFAMSSTRKRPVYRDDQLAEVHRPLLDLIGTHIQRAIEHAILTADLHLRSQTQEELNRRLSESLKSLESTQAQLIESSKMEAIGRLAGGVAHDFNNLLTVILNHAALAAAAVAPGTSESADLDQIVEAARRAADITSQLLALGRKQLQKGEHVELGEVAAEIGRILRTLLGGGISLAVEAEPGCTVFADRTQIEQVIMNLVINARDAMPDGGAVRVVIRHATPSDLASAPAVARTSPMVALEVIDTGTGMSEEIRARIFEPFFTTKAVGQGTGLGLSVVYGVVSQSGGEISVHSAAGMGTRFLILLPRRDRVAPAPAAELHEPTVATASILVVEDSAAIRRVVGRILGRVGYHVQEAADGVEALAVIGASPPFDLVLTDLNMPNMGGFELAERLPAVSPRTTVVFMTGYSEELADASRRAPQWPCMSKPFTPAQLLTQIREQLACSALAHQAR